MILPTMRFAGYEWKHNPLSVEVTHTRILQENILPFHGERVKGLGRQCRVIRGRGELVGSDCIEQYKEIERLFFSGETGILSVPGMMPVRACFSKLSADGGTAPDVLRYSFEFTEIDSTVPMKYRRRVHVCTGEETLFDIAFDEGVTVDFLVKLNPWVRRPDELGAGEKVRLC